MTFLDAVRANRPMRRRIGTSSGPWIAQGALCREDRPHPGFGEPWVRTDTGDQLTLSREDYLADDWEIRSDIGPSAAAIAMTAPAPESCADNTPPWFVGHWRDWHRGHGCDRDDGKPRSEAAKVEIAQHAANTDSGHLTDAELGYLRAATSSGNELLCRALDELTARRQSTKAGAGC